MDLESLPHLYVEGKSDEYAIAHLLMKHGISAHVKHGKKLKAKDQHKIQVVVEFPVDERTDEPEATGGRDKLLDGWSIQLRSPVASAIGLVLDADTWQFHRRGLEPTWAAVRERLSQDQVKIEAPELPDVEGFFGVHAFTQTPVGVWIMPDNQGEGSTEDFLRQLISVDDSLIGHAESSTRSAKDDHKAPYEEKDFQQATLAAWLAWQKDPPMSYGSAFNHHVLKHDVPVAQRFVVWVRRLIESATPNSTT
jgi:hypothetical protein